MVRKSAPPAVTHNDADETAISGAVSAAGELSEQFQVISQHFGYALAYNRDRIIDEVGHFMGEAARSMLRAGAGLAMIRSQEPHGEWLATCEQLNIDPRTAQRMISAASKFANATTSSHLERLGTSKLFELLVLDDDDAELLGHGGAVAGLGTVDDIAGMTVKELRAAVRELREDGRAKDGLLAKKSETIDQLQTKKAKVKPPTDDEEGAQLRRETSDWAHNAEAIIRGSLRDGLEQLQRHAVATGANHDEFASGILAQLDRAMADLRGQLLIKAAPDGNSTPEWDKN